MPRVAHTPTLSILAHALTHLIRTLIQVLRWLSTIQLDLPAVMPLSCVMHVDFHTTLVLQTALPLALVGFLYITTHILRVIERRHAQRRSALRRSASRKSGTGKRLSRAEATALLKPLTERLRSTCMNGIFLILFLVYPGAIAKSFAAFQCIPLEEVNLRLLRSDFSIDCDSGSHQLMQWGYALPAVFLYPLGVPILLLTILWHHRVRLRYWRDMEAAAEASAVIMALGLPDPRSEENQSSIAGVREAAKTDAELPPYLLRLTAGYECKYAWFEVFEMARKLALIGLAVFFESGSLSQVAYGLIVCFASFGLFMLWSPYQDPGEDRLAQLSQVQIFVALVASVILRADPSKNSTENLDIILTVMLFCPFLLALLLVTPLPAIFKRCLRRLGRCVRLVKQHPHEPSPGESVSERISKDKLSPPARASMDRRSHLDDVIDDLIDGFGVRHTSTARVALPTLPPLAPQRLPAPDEYGRGAASKPPRPQSVTVLSDALTRRSVSNAFFSIKPQSSAESPSTSTAPLDHELYQGSDLDARFTERGTTVVSEPMLRTTRIRI